MTPNRTVVFGVSSAQSLKLLGSLPEVMAARGWSVHVVSSGTGFFSRGVQHHSIKMRRKPSPIHDLVALFQWWQLLGKIRPAVVSVGTPKAAFLGLMAARWRGVPARVYVLRGLRCEGARGPAGKLLALIERLTVINATTVLAVSRSLQALYSKLNFAPSAKVRVIGLGSSHGVDTLKFAREEPSGLDPAIREWFQHKGVRPILGFVGRFAEDKGASTLLACREYLLEQGLDHEFVLVGPIETKPSVLAAMSHRGRPVLYAGAVEHSAPYYQLLDLLLLPTRREGFPNVVLEAAAAGVPALTTSATGAVDSVVSGVTGEIVPKDDVEAFCRAAENLLSSPKLLKLMGDNARLRVLRDFDETDVVARHASFYEQLLS